VIEQHLHPGDASMPGDRRAQAGGDRTTRSTKCLARVDRVTGLLLPVPSDRLFERFTRCIGGLALFGLGAALFIGSDLGAAPWDVFHQGVANQTGLPLGLVIQMTGLLIVASWYPLGLRPGWGTLLNAIEIGLVVMLAGQLLPETESLLVRSSYQAIGLLCVGVGSGLYIGAGLGSGPRDGLMLGLSRGRMTVGITRTGIEVSVLLAGIALGGTAGVGTAVFAFGIGPGVHYWMPRLRIATLEPAMTLAA
jgi:uncharacterized membrane protein YczE